MMKMIINTAEKMFNLKHCLLFGAAHLECITRINITHNKSFINLWGNKRNMHNAVSMVFILFEILFSHCVRCMVSGRCLGVFGKHSLVHIFGLGFMFFYFFFDYKHNGKKLNFLTQRWDGAWLMNTKSVLFDIRHVLDIIQFLSFSLSLCWLSCCNIYLTKDRKQGELLFYSVPAKWCNSIKARL